MRIGICGTGAFADAFIPLFKAHPGVDSVVLCDRDADKLREKSRQFGIAETCPDLDALCQKDVEGIALFTQHHLHGEQARLILDSGKDVFSAVPSAGSVEEMEDLVKAVKRSGRIYMLAETSYYYPSALYCRERFRRGDFGRVVYAEGEYYHDASHGLYEVMQWRHGVDWKQYFGFPPFHYPTHSLSMVLSVTGSRVVQVSGMGITDDHPDGLYQRADNRWRNPFSNEVMLCRMADGSVARFNEFRRIGHPGNVGLSVYGTEGSYEEQVGSRIWVTRNRKETQDLTDLLMCRKGGANPGSLMGKVRSEDGTHSLFSPLHPVERLPMEFEGQPNGHRGSHQFLVDDFVRAVLARKHPPTHVWAAARYLLPGLVAHQSALQGGELLEVPDFGGCPEQSTLELETKITI